MVRKTLIYCAISVVALLINACTTKMDVSGKELYQILVRDLRGDRMNSMELVAVRDGRYEIRIEFPSETVRYRVPLSDIKVAGYDPAGSELPLRLTLADLELGQGDGTYRPFVRRNR